MSDKDAIRKAVSKSYATAVTSPSAGCCGSQRRQKGVAVKLAGYDGGELDALPADAVENSFGCGNPVAFSQVQPGDVVLDLGSGAGIDLLLASKKVGLTGRVIGVDMTDEMIARAQENISAAGVTNVEIRKGIIEDLPEDASIDWVISNCVINLSPDKAKVFSEIARVLKPGGAMVVSDIVVSDLPSWVRSNPSLYSSCIAGAIPEEDYVAGLAQAGMGEVEVLERIVYGRPHLVGLLESEIVEGSAARSCCQDAPLTSVDIPSTVDAMAASLEGKIWSARFHARKT
jgi:SAM-dependent methyltransferase